MPATIVPARTAADLSFLDALSKDEAARQRAILRARRYHEGEHLTFLTERLRAFLGAGTGNDAAFRLNVVRTVVTAVVERLIVAGFQCADKAQGEWAWQLWQANRMDDKQADVHEQAVRDGESFVIVDWDEAKSQPRFTPHPRYTDTQVNGDGFGCVMVYPDDDVMAEPKYAVKRWTERLGTRARQRATLYYPERVERYYYENGWKPLTAGNPGQARQGGGGQWPMPWVDAAGQPLGIPVVHFKNPALRCEAWDALPLQDAVNKLLIDLLASGDVTAFRIFYALGFIPTTDGQQLRSDGANALKIEPGQIIGTTTGRDKAAFGAIDGASPQPILEALNQTVLYLAVTTETPVSRFQFTRQIAAEGTLKQQEDPLLAKVRQKQTRFGNGWEDTLVIARRLQNAFGSAGEMGEEPLFETQWTAAETRSHEDRREEWKAKKELGVPLEQIWREMGYTQEQIDAMRATEEYRARLALVRAALNPEVLEGGGAGA